MSVFTFVSGRGLATNYPPAELLQLWQADFFGPASVHKHSSVVTLIVKVNSSRPVCINVVHRHCVEMYDATEGIISPSCPADRALRDLGYLQVWPELWKAQYALPESDELAVTVGVIPEHRDFRVRKMPYEWTGIVKKKQIPFTCASFGPFPKATEPYILRLAIKVAEPAYSQLFGLDRNPYSDTDERSVYLLTGQDSVCRDIREHRERPWLLPALWRDQYLGLIDNLWLPHQLSCNSYTFTCLDSSLGENIHYTQQRDGCVAAGQRLFVERTRLLKQVPGPDLRVRTWYSEREYYTLIRNVLFNPLEQNVSA